jgi:hypothetical protein
MSPEVIAGTLKFLGVIIWGAITVAVLLAVCEK